MAHFWHRPTDGPWQTLPLVPRPWALVGDPLQPLLPLGEGSSRAAVEIREAADRWLLIADPLAPLAVNGQPIPLGLHVLRDRDEIRLADGPELFFSTEKLARVESYSGAAQPEYCPRCKLIIGPEAGPAVVPVVRCPECHVVHHQSDEFPCWTYAPTCALCSCPTEISENYRWTPEEL